MPAPTVSISSGPPAPVFNTRLGENFSRQWKNCISGSGAPSGRSPALLLETKGYSIAVHYRLVAEGAVAEVETVVDGLLQDYAGLRKSHGKKVFEIRPRFDWNKGKAVGWILQALGLDHPGVVPPLHG